jgi:hypothetical protein
MRTEPTPGASALVPFILLFALVGLPLVAYLWETVNELLSGFVSGTRLLVSLPLLAILVGLLVVLARRVRRLDPRQGE